MYGCETWTISEAMKKQLEAAEMWFLRRMMKISWKKKVTNEDVLRRAQKFLEWLGKCLDRRGVDIIRLVENRSSFHAVKSNVRT